MIWIDSKTHILRTLFGSQFFISCTMLFIARDECQWVASPLYSNKWFRYFTFQYYQGLAFKDIWEEFEKWPFAVNTATSCARMLLETGTSFLEISSSSQNVIIGAQTTVISCSTCLAYKCGLINLAASKVVWINSSQNWLNEWVASPYRNVA